MDKRLNIIATTLLVSAILEGLLMVNAKHCVGKCVAMDKCRDLNMGGTNFFDVRVGREDEDEDESAPCEHYLQVCCTDVMESSTEGPPGTFGTFDLIPPPSFKRCGERNAEGAGFTITHAENGETQFGEFPWMVAVFALQDPEKTDKKYICGGSLVKPNVVMTAAHCVFNKIAQTLIVRAGDWDTRTENERRPYQEQPVSSVIIHEAFNSHLLLNDIALLILEKPFQADEHIQLICLPPIDLPFEKSNCFATGWGKSRFDSPQYQVILKKVELPLVSHAECQQALRTTRLGRNFHLHESFTCAGGEEGVDTCTGDGGSPLVCPISNEPGRYQQLGIVAWGIKCAQRGIPGVYVKTSLFTKWVEAKVIELDSEQAAIQNHLGVQAIYYTDEGVGQ